MVEFKHLSLSKLWFQESRSCFVRPEFLPASSSSSSSLSSATTHSSSSSGLDTSHPEPPIKFVSPWYFSLTWYFNLTLHFRLTWHYNLTWYLHRVCFLLQMDHIGFHSKFQTDLQKRVWFVMHIKLNLKSQWKQNFLNLFNFRKFSVFSGN